MMHVDVNASVSLTCFVWFVVHTNNTQSRQREEEGEMHGEMHGEMKKKEWKLGAWREERVRDAALAVNTRTHTRTRTNYARVRCSHLNAAR